MKLDATQPSAQVAPRDADVGFAAKASLEKLLKEKISDLQALEFKKDCITMLASTVAKIQERSPLKHSLARKLVCLDPQKMVSTPEEAVKMFQAVLQKLIHSGQKTSSQGDSTLSQFRRFVSDARMHHQEQFSSYKHNYTRLDSFLCDTLSKDEEFKELWSTLQILLTLSHSQAAVKRGFSVNKEVLPPNMQEMNLKAIRLVHISVASLKIKTSDFTVTDKLLKSCSHASNKYKMYLMKKAEKEKTDMGQKRKALQDELIAAKKKKTELESVARQLLDTANKKAKEAEKKSHVAAMKALIMESNAS